jgi:AmmeMemoRadiSam system protein A
MKITDLAREAINYYLETGKIHDVPKNLSQNLSQPAGAFVTLHHKNGDLRGCIGTIAPTKSSLAAEVIANAVSAATQDPRFSPVSPTELDNLEVSVDVLSEPTAAKELSALDPKKYGLIVAARDGRQGVLLPDVDGVDSIDEQISICRDKGGINPDEPTKIYKFEVERYK